MALDMCSAAPLFLATLLTRIAITHDIVSWICKLVLFTVPFFNDMCASREVHTEAFFLANKHRGYLLVAKFKIAARFKPCNEAPTKALLRNVFESVFFNCD